MASIKHAKEIYKTLCDFLDSLDWTYEKIEDELLVHVSASWEKQEVFLSIQVDDQLEIIRILSPLDIVSTDETSEFMAVAVSTINNELIAGCFDYDCDEHSLFFCLTTTYKESTIGAGLMSYLISTSGSMVDKYFDKLETVAKGGMSFDEIVEYVRNDND